jgi:hypothetical protein
MYPGTPGPGMINLFKCFYGIIFPVGYRSLILLLLDLATIPSGRGYEYIKAVSRNTLNRSTDGHGVLAGGFAYHAA